MLKSRVWGRRPQKILILTENWVILEAFSINFPLYIVFTKNFRGSRAPVPLPGTGPDRLPLEHLQFS